MKFIKLRDVKTPERGTPFSAGLDFFVPNDVSWDRIELFPGEGIIIPSGIKVKVPHGYMLCTFNKGSIALNKHLQVGACVIDEDYQGEVHIHVINIGSNSTIISRGEKLVQFILIPVLYESLYEVKDEKYLYEKQSERADGAFGSTNK
jgi:dUTP pyrophosphatase